MDTNQILLEKFIATHPAEAAQAIKKYNESTVVEIIMSLPMTHRIILFSQMKDYRGAKCLKYLDLNTAKDLLENLDEPVSESILRHCETSYRSELLDTVNPKLATTLRQKLNYGEKTIGAMMNPGAFALSEQTIVEDAIEIVKQEKERISTELYVINEKYKLLGFIMLYKLFLSNPSVRIIDLMDKDIPKFQAEMSIKSISNHQGWQKHRSIPVIDRTEKLIGSLDFASIQKSKIKEGREISREVLETSNSLGELYRIGFTGFLQSLS